MLNCGDGLANYSLICCPRLSSNRLLTWISGQSSMFCACCYHSLHHLKLRRTWSCRKPRLCHTTSPKRCARRSSAFSANRPTDNRRLTLSLAMVNCCTLCAEGVSDELEGSPPQSMPQRRRRFLLKEFRRSRNNSISLHSNNVAEFPKHPEH